jgi:hypothetical protein
MYKTLMHQKHIVFLPLFLLLFSCTKRSEKETLESDKIQILGKTYSVPVIWKTDLSKKSSPTARVSNENISSAKVIFTSSQLVANFNDLKNQTNGLSGVQTSNLISVFYYSESSYDNIVLSTIRAVATFSNEGAKMRHRFYLRNIATNTFTETTGLNILVDNYTNLDFETLLKNSVSSNATVASYLFATTDPEVLKGPLKNSEATYLSKAIIEFGYPLPDDAKCARPCNRSPGACNKGLDKDGNVVYTCDECVKGTMRAYAQDNNISLNFDELPDAFAYKFRDSFLVNYPLGRAYFNYYYKLSYVTRAYKPFTISNMLQNFNFAKGVYAVANKLQYGQSGDIIVSPVFRTDANTMIDYYKTLSNHLEYNQILNTIKNDLTRFENKTRAEVLALMNQ